MSSVLDPARRAALAAAQLTALLGDDGATAVAAPTSLGTGSAVVVADGTAWMLAGDQPERSLGAALALAVRHRCGLGPPDRRQRYGAAGSAGARPGPAHPSLAPRGSHPDRGRAPNRCRWPPRCRPAICAFAAEIVAGGAVPVSEHGVLAGEVAGLEVCRVVDDPFTGAVRLEVGVGAHDRETFQLLHGDRPTIEALTDVVQFVARHRSGAVPHPLKQLGASRFLRHRLITQPELIGLSELVARRAAVATRQLEGRGAMRRVQRHGRHLGGVRPRRRSRCGALCLRRVDRPSRTALHHRGPRRVTCSTSSIVWLRWCASRRTSSVSRPDGPR